MALKKAFTKTTFRDELNRLMPGYKWTVKQQRGTGWMDAEGTQSRGFIRTSTLRVKRIEYAGKTKGNAKTVRYDVYISGVGKKAPCFEKNSGETLAQALRNLQDVLELQARDYTSFAKTIQAARKAPAPAPDPVN